MTHDAVRKWRLLKQIPWAGRMLLLALRGTYRHTGERVCPDFPDENFANHLKVYEFAGQFVPDKAVLDVGCGTGYGCDYLAGRGARSVVGIDYSDEAIDYAKSRYKDTGVEFTRMDAQELDYPDDHFDVIFSSENLEHLPDPERNVAEMRRVLRRDGLLILGTPNKEVFSPGREGTSNPFHLKEFYYDELRDLCRRHFEMVHLFENSMPSPFELGRKMKQDRVAAGEVGIDSSGQPSMSLGALHVDLEHLHNTHSFMVLAS